jgi:type VI secretion system secreted protein VgrG
LRGAKLPDDVQTVDYRAREAISRPYEVEVEFYTEDASFDANACLRSSMVLTVIQEHGNTRFFHGICHSIAFERHQHERLFFRVTLKPSLAAFDLREDCRIFQDLSIVNIVMKLLEEAALADQIRSDLVGDYQPHDFTVQYRESALNFMERLLEDNGIFYFFEHKEDGHTMILADHHEGFVPLDVPAVVFSRAAGVAAGANALDAVTRTRSLRTTVTQLRDYDFEHPDAPPQCSIPYEDRWAASHFDYPGGFIESAEGELKTNARLRQLRFDADEVCGESEAADLRVGAPFSIEGASEGDLNGNFVVVGLESHGHQDPSDVTNNFACKNHFVAVPAGVSWKPARRARRPRIRGIQTAIVTGDSAQDQAIHVDKFGRIKVRFFWDRIGQEDANSSCWIRVSQVPLGGSMILPRVGWEVSVAFLDGDPDRPLVLGRLYNAEHAPPQALPGAKACGSLKSMSSPGGAGHNLIGADDSGGKQGFNIHAQKDLNLTTGNDWTEEIGVDDTTNVTKNVKNSVGVDDATTIGADQTLNVGANLSYKISADQGVTVGGNDDYNATCDYVENIGGSRTYTVGGNHTTICNADRKTVKGSFTRSVGSVQITASVASIADNILVSRTSNVGAVRAQLIKGTHGEVVNGLKSQTSAAAEVHVNRANHVQNCNGAVTMLVGALHYQKIDGDYAVKAPMITLLGAAADIKGGSSTLKLGGGPIVAKGSRIALAAPMVIKMGTSLKEA